MPETDRFDEVERQARSARAALDAAVADTPVPDVPTHRRPSTWRNQPMLVVAAAVVIVSLVGAALLSSGGDDNQSTVAGQPEDAYLVLPEPGSLGFELAAAFDGSQPSPAGLNSQDVVMTVQAPADTEDPWAASVVEYSLPGDATTLPGETVDIGGPEATMSTSGVAPTVSWIDGDQARFLLSQNLSVGELVVLARQVVASDTDSGSPLPGYTVVFTGTAFDLLPLLATSTGVPSGVAGVAYVRQDSDAGFVLTTMPGSNERWRATFATAETVERTTVRGRDAVVADFAVGVTEVSWIEADGTLVRVNTSRSADIALPAVLDYLVEIDPDDFSTLVDAHPVPDDRSPAWFIEGRQEPGDRDIPGATPGRPVAQVETEEDDITYRATLLVGDAGTVTLETLSSGPAGTTASAAAVETLETSTAVRNTANDARDVLVAGIIGPNVSRVDIIDPDTGTVIEGSGPSTATIDGSDHVLFMGRIDNQWSSQDLVVVGVTADGTTIEIDL